MNGPNNPIGWTNWTWNPISGCKNGCKYCYARKIATRFTPKNRLGDDCTQPGNGLHEIRYKSQPFKYGFEPTLHSYRLYEPLIMKEPSKIFVCSMADLFGEWVPDEWIHKVLKIVKQCPQHVFQFLTKNSSRYKNFDFPKNCWLGVTITGTEKHQSWKYRHLAVMDNIRFISFEPLLYNPLPIVENWQDWLIIGSLTGPGSKKYRPKVEWIENILKQADRHNVPVFMKNSLSEIWDKPLRQEFPKINEK